MTDSVNWERDVNWESPAERNLGVLLRNLSLSQQRTGFVQPLREEGYGETLSSCSCIQRVAFYEESHRNYLA